MSMKRVLRLVSPVAFLAVAAAPTAQGKQTFTGTITDSMCADAVHSRMRMGPSDAECTLACVSAHDADYVLYDGKRAYVLSDQKAPEKFAGQKVTVVGTLDAGAATIRVESIASAK
jgi:type 1 fimbria pilin